ncbi:MAG: phenylalanine--tRNA ligase subunit alpha [Candidatus Aenigmarchaeota archaeon]|nr:phenylalanine--tRNA ligase subunit alpha [Candidatus Aenigmarchaeota archaeon]
MKKFKLTEEGEKYAKEGLPEKNLIELLTKKKSLDMGKAKDSVFNFAIAFQWAKKNKWVDIKKGKLILLRKPGKIAEQDALQNLSNGDDIDEKTLDMLCKRRLVEEIREDALKKAQKLVGKDVTNLTEDLIKTGLWKDVKLKPYNVEAVGKKVFIGKRQPYNAFLSEVRQKLVELGFREMTGPIIELEFWNFDAMYQGQGHPSRDWTQTYNLKEPKMGTLPDKNIVNNVKETHENGWKTGSTGWGYEWNPKKAAQLMPRAHGTALSARTLANMPEIPGKYFAIARCYRPDIIDATHGVEFNQTEGIVIDKDLNFRNLLGLLKQFAVEFASADKVKFHADYYPFTEPSVQLSAKHPELGWVEFAGAGIFRPEFTQPLGVMEPVLAWGLGIDRLAMFKLDIKDIRNLFTRNLGWLRKRSVL